jgi:predicted NAD/FAD-binding protein
LWAPLCLAALNTPPAQASAQVFLNVLRDSFASTRADSDLVLPLVDLSRLFPEPAGAWIEARGSTLRRRTRVRRIARDGRGLRIGTDSGGGRPDSCAAVVIATAASQAAHLLEALGEAPATRALLDRIRFEPITTIYLEFPARVRFAEPIRQLGGGPGQWVFDRTANHPGSRLAIVISADGPHRRLAHDALVDAALAQLRDQFDDAALRSAPVRSQVITERRATHACTPERPQPAAAAIAERVFLAGDYTYAEYPATLEAAVRAGVRAARAVLAQY